MIRLPAVVVVMAACAAFSLAGSGCTTALPERAWCSNLTELTGRDCTYDTFEQCMVEIRGLSNGNCTQNPRYRPKPSRVR